MKSNSYIPGKGLYYSFDPRAKMLFTILISVVLFLPVSAVAVYVLALLILLFSVTQTGLKATWHAFSLILPMLAFMVLFMPLQQRGSEPLLSAGSLVLVTREGLYSFSLFACRFIFISILFSLLLATTDPKDILPAFRFYRLPYNASLVLSLSIRFIPEIGATYRQIRDSQRLRLPNPDDERARKHKFRSMLPTLTSTLVVVLKNIPYSAAALELRGYGRSNGRTSFHVLPPARGRISHFLIALSIPVITFLIGIIIKPI